MSSEARTLTADNAAELAAWCGGVPVMEHNALTGAGTPGINVPVGDGAERASTGDMIIRNNDGSFRVFKNSAIESYGE